jgi:23S rRNA pseudouridine1911/1915/1917 synthase
MENNYSDIKIVYEDSDFLVINKPAGLIVHPKNAEDSQPSVTQWLIERYPETKNVGEDPLRPGLVHRLDKETSGLLLLVKNQESFTYFKKLFQDRKIQKHYLALTHGQPKSPSGIIDSPLGRIGMKRTTRLIGKKMVDPKDAVTEYRTIREFTNYTLLDVRPKTGRTHQIRVHLKSIRCPIVGDVVYGKQSDRGLPMLLHAYKLEFTSPSGKALTVEADIPDYFSNFIDKIGV